MNKILSALAIILLILSFSCDSAGNGSSDSENPAEAAGALASAGAVMRAGYSNPILASSPALVVTPFRLSAPVDPTPYDDGIGGVAYYSWSAYTIDFDNFHVTYDGNQYVLKGLISDCTCDFISDPITASFAGDVTIEGGSLSGTYSVDIEVELGFSYAGDDIIISGTVTGTVNGESVSITINETIPAP